MTDRALQGRRIREAREKAGKSQAEAAERVGRSRQSYIAVEQGKARLTETQAAALAELFGCPVADLLGQSPESTELLKRALLQSLEVTAKLGRYIDFVAGRTMKASKRAAERPRRKAKGRGKVKDDQDEGQRAADTGPREPLQREGPGPGVRGDERAADGPGNVGGGRGGEGGAGGG